MVNIFRKLKATISLVISICLITVFCVNYAYAQTDNAPDDIIVTQNNQALVEVMGKYKGDELYATFDKQTRKVTMKAVEKARVVPYSSLLESKKTTLYEVEIEELSDENISAVLTDTKTNKKYKINENNQNKVKAQAAVLGRIGVVIGSKLLKRLRDAGKIVTLGGITYVAASEIADTIRKGSHPYYIARIYQKTVVVGDSIDEATATIRAKSGGDVFSKTKLLAQSLAAKASTVGIYYGPEVSNNGEDGYFHHYHPWEPVSKNRPHLFFFNY